MAKLSGILAGAARGALSSYSDTLQTKIDAKAQAERDLLLQRRQEALARLQASLQGKLQEEQHGRTSKTQKEMAELQAELQGRLQKEQHTRTTKSAIEQEKLRFDNEIKLLDHATQMKGSSTKDQEFQLKQRKAYFDTFTKEIERLTNDGTLPVTEDMKNQARAEARRIAGLPDIDGRPSVNHEDIFAALGVPQNATSDKSFNMIGEAGILQRTDATKGDPQPTEKSEPEKPKYGARRNPTTNKIQHYKIEDGKEIPVSKEEYAKQRSQTWGGFLNKFLSKDPAAPNDFEQWDLSRKGEDIVFANGRKAQPAEIGAYLEYLRETLSPSEFQKRKRELFGS